MGQTGSHNIDEWRRYRHYFRTTYFPNCSNCSNCIYFTLQNGNSPFWNYISNSLLLFIFIHICLGHNSFVIAIKSNQRAMTVLKIPTENTNEWCKRNIVWLHVFRFMPFFGFYTRSLSLSLCACETVSARDICFDDLSGPACFIMTLGVFLLLQKLKYVNIFWWHIQYNIHINIYASRLVILGGSTSHHYIVFSRSS